MKKIVFSNITGNRPIFFVYISLFVLLTITAVTVVTRFGKIAKSYDELTINSVNKLKLLLDSRENNEYIQKLTIDKAFHPDGVSKEEEKLMDKKLNQNEINLQQYGVLLESEKEKEVFNKLMLAWKAIKQTDEKFLSLKENEGDAIRFYHSQQAKVYENLQTSVSALSVVLNDVIKTEGKEVKEFRINSQALINSYIAGAAILLIVLGVMVVKNVKKLKHQNEILSENEKILEESENQYKNLFNKSPLPKWVCDRQTLQFYEVNDAAIENYGYSRNEFLKMAVFDLFANENKERLLDLRYKEDHKNSKTEIEEGSNKLKNGIGQHRKKNGKIIIVDVALHPVNYGDAEAYLAIAHDLTENLQLQQQLTEEKINKQKEITRATINAQEKEREEVGKELHDNVNQILTTVKLYLDSAVVTPQKENEFIERSRQLVNAGIGEIRRISKSLVPPSLGELTLRDALRELIMSIKFTQKNIHFRTKGLNEEILSDSLKISIYRIVQEQLNNIIKYADASQISITIHQQNDTLDLQIADNGRGFDMGKKRGGIGIANITNRATTFNGKLFIDSSPGNGCRVNVHFKLPCDGEKIFIKKSSIHTDFNNSEP
jgi:PAS domain S-box-containing protein